jgi:hypothetical protein
MGGNVARRKILFRNAKHAPAFAKEMLRAQSDGEN